MIQVQVTSGMARSTEAVNEKTTTPKELLTKAGVKLDTATINLDGTVLARKELDSTFEQLGVKPDNMYFLSAVVKTTNA